MRTTLISTSLLIAAALALPAGAAADSIVYADQGDIWSASPDGTHKVQLTEGAGYHSPSQADDGTIAAARGDEIVVMAKDGRPIRTIRTQPARTGNGGTFAARPVDLSFSPDGTKIAYAYTALSCPPASTCTGQTSVFYTRADVTEATPQSTWGNQFGASNPEWVTNDRTVVQNAARVALDDLGGGDYSFTDWLAHTEDLGDPEITRDGTRMAMTYSYGPSKFISFYLMNGTAVSGPPPASPSAVCATGTSEDLADPTWSPDGTGAAFEDTDGINVFRFTSFTKENCSASGPVVISATGRTPDWGPADPPAARYQAPSGGTSPAPPATPKPQTAPIAPGTTPAGALAPGSRTATPSFTLPKVTRTTLRKGLTVHLTKRAKGKATVVLTAKGKRLARGTAKAGARSVRLSKVGVSRLAALKGQSVTVTVTVAGAKTSRTVKVG